MEGINLYKVCNKQKSLDPYHYRKDFPILEETFPAVANNGHLRKLVYFDNAATTQKPRAVIEALVNYYEHQNANVHRAIHQLGERATVAYEESRKKVARFLHANSEREIIFTRGTTESINLVAAVFGKQYLKPGDEILLTEMEHHSNLVPWQMLAHEKGIRLRFIPFMADGTLDCSDLETLINEKTRLVTLTHMSNVFGTINPVRGITRTAHKRGIPVLLDGAQSVPHLPINVQELDCDFLAFSGHKMCAPTGIGVLYGKEKWLEQMEPFHGGGEMIRSVSLEQSTWNDLPHKFEAGTPDIAGAIGLGAAIDYLSEIGMEKIAIYEQQLTACALAKMREFKEMRIFGNATERGGAISFYFGQIHPHDMAQFLDNMGIAVRAGHHCAQPVMRKLAIPATTRLSFYFYNTFEEVDVFIAGLNKAKEFFA